LRKLKKKYSTVRLFNTCNKLWVAWQLMKIKIKLKNPHQRAGLSGIILFQRLFEFNRIFGYY
jgi:hypothetical protein